MYFIPVLFIFSSSGGVDADGNDWMENHDDCCPAGFACEYDSQYYSQCKESTSTKKTITKKRTFNFLKAKAKQALKGTKGLIHAKDDVTCKTDSDCNGGGTCSAQGVCACDRGWTGDHCEKIKFGDAFACGVGGLCLDHSHAAAADGGEPYSDFFTSSWGGEAVEGDDGQYHMYAASFGQDKGK